MGAALRDELGVTSAAAERPALTAVALALAAILDKPPNMWGPAGAARQLVVNLGTLSKRMQRRGKLAVVKSMTAIPPSGSGDVTWRRFSHAQRCADKFESATCGEDAGMNAVISGKVRVMSASLWLRHGHLIAFDDRQAALAVVLGLPSEVGEAGWWMALRSISSIPAWTPKRSCWSGVVGRDQVSGPTIKWNLSRHRGMTARSEDFAPSKGNPLSSSLWDKVDASMADAEAKESPKADSGSPRRN